MPASKPILSEDRLPTFFRVRMRSWAKLYAGFSEVFWPFTDIVVRFFVAMPFLRSGIVKASDWDTTLLLAEVVYPVSWMDPWNAAVTGLTIELLGAILLLLGLFTRPAAFAMMILTIVAQAVYIPTTTNLMLIAILFWYVVHGPAVFSFDRLFAPGLHRSALPFAKPLTQFAHWFREKGSPLALTLVRLWLALSLAGYAGLFEPNIALATWLPTTVFTGTPQWLAILFAGLLLIGLAASFVAPVLALLTGFFMLAGVHSDVTFYPILLLAIYEARGAGYLSFDAWIARWTEANLLFDRDYRDIPEDWPHIVIIGAGFGGLAAANRLKPLPVRITILDKRNYHLFQPLLYQIATATLNPADIATPIRSLFRSDGNVRVLKGEVSGVDTDAKTVTYGGPELGQHQLSYDKLIIATGATHCYFGRDEWASYAPGLKTIENGVAVRASILEAFEQAEAIDDEARIKRLLTFVVVGAGPTGVELAGAIAELAKVNVEREFRKCDPAEARVILLQSGDRILPAFPPELSQQAAKSLEALGVEIRTGGRVTEIAERHVVVDGETTIDTETVLWAAGVAASPAANWLNAESDMSGRIVVNENLRVKVGEDILRDVFAVGDTACSTAWEGRPVPGLAPAAKQAGTYVGRLVEAELLSKPCPDAFKYKHQGSLATIGRKSAVADFGRFQLSGAMAWWLWGVVHVGFLSGARNRLTVILNWAWNFFANHSGVRLITKD